VKAVSIFTDERSAGGDGEQVSIAPLLLTTGEATLSLKIDSRVTTALFTS